MNFDNCIPFIISHVLEGSVPQDAGVIDEDIYPAEAIFGRRNHIFCILIIGHRTIIRDRFPASLSDFFDDTVRHAGACTRAISGAPQIVYDY